MRRKWPSLHQLSQAASPDMGQGILPTHRRRIRGNEIKGDYTQVPRGRVAWNIDKFIVLVGHWADPIQDELTELLEQEFSLPYFEFVYDEHWDLGHGWSGDMASL